MGASRGHPRTHAACSAGLVQVVEMKRRSDGQCAACVEVKLKNQRLRAFLAGQGYSSKDVAAIEDGLELEGEESEEEAGSSPGLSAASSAELNAGYVQDLLRRLQCWLAGSALWDRVPLGGSARLALGDVDLSQFESAGGALRFARSVVGASPPKEKCHVRDRLRVLFLTKRILDEAPAAARCTLASTARGDLARCEASAARQRSLPWRKKTGLWSHLASQWAEPASVDVQRLAVNAVLAACVFASAPHLLVEPLGKQEYGSYFCAVRGTDARGAAALTELFDRWHTHRATGGVRLPPDAGCLQTPAPAPQPWWCEVPTPTKARLQGLSTEPWALAPGWLLSHISRAPEEAPVVVERAPVLAAVGTAAVGTYTFSARLKKNAEPVLAADTERGRRAELLGYGALVGSWTRRAETLVWASAPPGQADRSCHRGSGFAYVGPEPRLAPRMAAALQVIGAHDAPAVLRGSWLARLAACYAAPDIDGALCALTVPRGSPAHARQLELDLLAVLCSDSQLCFYCFLPMVLRGEPLRRRAELAALLAQRGVQIGQPKFDGTRRLEHGSCKHTSLAMRRARGRALVVMLARRP